MTPAAPGIPENLRAALSGRSDVPRVIRVMAIVRACGVVVAMVAGCRAPSTAARLCARAQQCNALGAATSVDECARDLDGELDHLIATRRAELDDAVARCLDRPTCGGMIDCVAALAH